MDAGKDESHNVLRLVTDGFYLLHQLRGSVTRPVRELKGFRTITPPPGESTEVTFPITEEMLRFHDIRMNYISEPGKFRLFIGFDSTAANSAAFTLK